jgi:hypothetical protein
MSFTAPDEPKRSRYFENGSPTRCHHCERAFKGSAIRDRYTNQYFCCGSCLESAQFIRFNRLPRKAS